MEDGPLSKFSGGRVALGCLFAVLGALVAPLLLSVGATLLWSPILIAVLYAWSGAAPALLCAALTMVSPGLFVAMVALMSGLPVPIGPILLEGMRLVASEPTWMLCAGLVLVLPGIASILLLKRRMAFPRAVACSIGVQLLMMAACVLALAMMHGPDLVGGFVGWFKAMATDMGVGSASGAMMGDMLLSMGRYGLFGLDTGIDFSQPALTAAQQLQLTNYMVDLIDRMLRRNLVSMILCSGALTGLLSYSLSARICARRGDEPPMPYMHIHEWRLPRDMVIALPVLAIVCAALNMMQLQGMDAAFVAMSNLCYLAFSVQGAGALARRLRQSGMHWGRRTGLVVAMFMLLPRILTLIGLWSALLGSRGVITLYMQKKNQSRGDR